MCLILPLLVCSPELAQAMAAQGVVEGMKRGADTLLAEGGPKVGCICMLALDSTGAMLGLPLLAAPGCSDTPVANVSIGVVFGNHSEHHS